ncbi:MAG: hypothetical protein QOF44_2777, partial [Streptomyces sp.]|nr:hypothetical protein [Streptomyces sp.]
ATADGATSAPAQAGLGNTAEALSDAVDARVRAAARALTPSAGSEPSR